MEPEPQTYTHRRRRSPYTAPPAGAGSQASTSALIALAAINIGVFMLWQFRDYVPVELMAAHFLVSVESVFSLRVWTLLTSAFSHVDATHLLFNLIGLYVFGKAIEERLGPRPIVHLYIAGALVASVGHVVYGLITGDGTPALGASGAVMAMAVVYAAMFPNRVLLLGFFIPVRAPIAVGLFVLLDLWGVAGVGAGSNIAHAAHLGGALYGLMWWGINFRGWLRPDRAQR